MSWDSFRKFLKKINPVWIFTFFLGLSQILSKIKKKKIVKIDKKIKDVKKKKKQIKSATKSVSKKSDKLKTKADQLEKEIEDVKKGSSKVKKVKDISEAEDFLREFAKKN